MQPTLRSLASFPEALELHYRSIPLEFRSWAPASWQGWDGERFTGVGHLCHVRDIETDGYHFRIRRALTEDDPALDSIDGYALAKVRDYAGTKDTEALADFRAARAETLRIIGVADAPDLGRHEVTGRAEDLRAFRTPSLRNVALTAPYMHDGSLPTLADVVRFYDGGGFPSAGLDPLIRPLALSADERSDLVAFLDSLTGSNVAALVADARSAPVGN